VEEPADRTARRLNGSDADELALGVALRLGLDSLRLGRDLDLDQAGLRVFAPLLVSQKLPFLPTLGMAHAALTSLPKQ
jgi:hypothetical protein